MWFYVWYCFSVRASAKRKWQEGYVQVRIILCGVTDGLIVASYFSMASLGGGQSIEEQMTAADELRQRATALGI